METMFGKEEKGSACPAQNAAGNRAGGAAFNDLARLVADCFAVPAVLICLEEEGHSWIAGCTGIEMAGVPEPAHAGNGMEEQGNVTPAGIHSSLQSLHIGGEDSPYRFQASVQVMSTSQERIGTLVILDHADHTLTAEKKSQLDSFARLAAREAEHVQLALRKKAADDELARREAQMHAALKAGKVTPWHWDLHSNKVFGGIELANMFGLDPSEAVMGLSLDHFITSIHPEDVQMVVARINQTIGRGEEYEAEYRTINYRNEPCWVIARGQVQYGDNGKPQSFDGVLVDITDTKKAEQEIKAKNRDLEGLMEELQFVTDFVPQLVWATDASGNFVYFNKGWLEYTGLQIDKVKGDGWTQSLHPEDYARTYSAWRMAVENSSEYEVEYRLKRKDGVYRWFVARGVPLKDAEGSVLKWYGTTTDIEDKKNAEAALEEVVRERTRELHQSQEEVKQGDELVRAIVDQSPTGIVLYDSIRNDKGAIVDFRARYFNYKGNELTGFSNSERESLTFREILRQLNHESQFRHYVQVVESGESQAWEEYFSKTGRWLAISVTRLNDGFLRTLTDITEIKNAQQALQQQMGFVNSVLNASINGVIVLDAIWGSKGTVEDFRVIKINEAFKTIVGLDESIVGRNYSELFPHTNDTGTFELYRNVLLTGKPARREIYSPDQDLNSWFDVSVVRRGDNGVVVSFSNVSVQREAAIRLEEQKRLLDNILRYSPSGITVTEFIRDAEGKIVDGRTIIANEVSERHTGVPLQLTLRNTITENVPGILETPLFQQALKTLQTGEPFITQFYLETTGRWIELSVARMDENRLINLFTDVTSIKDSQIRLEKYVEQLTGANEELEQFTYVSHHDLQEPLRKIIMFTGMVLDDASSQLSGSSVTRLNKVCASARRMSTALRDVLNFASLREEDKPENVDLNEVLAAVQLDLELLIAEKNAEIIVDSLPHLQAVPARMNQLFYNLLNNALKFSKEGHSPRVSVTSHKLTEPELAGHPELDRSKSYYEIRVSDNGIGFPQELSEKIFMLFQRLHRRERYSGTGIGLALCKRVVTAQGGKIWAEGKEGEGSVFRVILPEE